MGWNTEALVELFYRPGTQLRRGGRDRCASTPRWSRRGASPATPDAIARVRTADNADLERLITDLQRNGLVIRTRSQVVMSRLVGRVGEGR